MQHSGGISRFFSSSTAVKKRAQWTTGQRNAISFPVATMAYNERTLKQMDNCSYKCLLSKLSQYVPFMSFFPVQNWIQQPTLHLEVSCLGWSHPLKGSAWCTCPDKKTHRMATPDTSYLLISSPWTCDLHVHASSGPCLTSPLPGQWKSQTEAVLLTFILQIMSSQFEQGRPHLSHCSVSGLQAGLRSWPSLPLHISNQQG